MSLAVFGLPEDLSQRTDAVRDRARVQVYARPHPREQLLFVTSRPPASARQRSVSNSFGGTATGTPSRVSRKSRASRRKLPNS
jgi:hypothetical protein